MPIELLVLVTLPIALIVIGRIVGSRLERAHYADIAEREARFDRQPAFSTKDATPLDSIRSSSLAVGSVVVSVDHFKRFVGGLRMLVGGEVRSYATLIERARREAVLRMKESQPHADAYVNTRIETSTIAGSYGEEGVGTVEVLAYGTAVQYDRAP